MMDNRTMSWAALISIVLLIAAFGACSDDPVKPPADSGGTPDAGPSCSGPCQLSLVAGSPGGTGAVLTYTVVVHGIATTLSVGDASTTAGGADTVNSVVVAAGDRVRIVVTKVAVAGGGSRRPEATLEVAA